MKILIFIGLFLSFFLLYSNRKCNQNDVLENSNEISFHNGTWKEALAKAKLENKLIFLDVYASWCGPCKRLKSSTFTDKEVGAYFNANFINVSIDGEKGEGLEISNTYHVNQYPSLYLIDQNGVIRKYEAGYQTPKELLKFAKSLQ